MVSTRGEVPVGPRVVIGEIHTGLLPHSTSLTNSDVARLLAIVPGEPVRSHERPIRQATSPTHYVGVDGPLGGMSPKRAVGTVASRAVVTGGQVLQVSSYAFVVEGRHSRQGWQHYLGRPGVLEVAGRFSASTLLAGLFVKDRQTERIDMGAIGSRLYGTLQVDPGLDQMARLRLLRTHLRWTAVVGEESRMVFRLDGGSTRTVTIDVHDGELGPALAYCEDLALHDWLLTSIIAVADRLGDIDTRQASARLRPVFDLLVPLWMPGARADEHAAARWRSLENSTRMSRQWEALVDRLRTGLDAADTAALVTATRPGERTSSPQRRTSQRRLASSFPLPEDLPSAVHANVPSKRHALGRALRPRWLTRTWSETSLGIRVGSILMWTLGLAIAGVGVLADIRDWWSGLQFTVNLVSSLAGAFIGIPIALMVIQRISARETRRHQRHERVVQAALRSMDDLVVTIRQVVLDPETVTDLVSQVHRLTEELIPTQTDEQYDTQLEEIFIGWRAICDMSWDSRAELDSALTALRNAEAQWWAFRENLGPQLRRQGLTWADSPEADNIRRQLHEAQDTFRQLADRDHDEDTDAIQQAINTGTTQPIKDHFDTTAQALVVLSRQARGIISSAGATSDLAASAVRLRELIREVDMDDD
ncbi:SCO2521 family protein [Longispora urticae]